MRLCPPALPLCQCAHDQGKAVANQQALDQDARVVAPGEDRKAKRKGNRIGLGEELAPNAGRAGEAAIAGARRGTAGNTAAVLLVDVAQLSPRKRSSAEMRNSTKRLKAGRKNAAPLGGIRREVPIASNQEPR